MITILTKHKYYTILYVDIYIISYRYTVTYMYTQNAYNYNLYTIFRQARQTRPNSGGVAEGHPRFDKGIMQQFFPFYALKIEIFRVFTLSD